MCSILSTRAPFWIHVLNSEYMCSILSTPVKFWVHVLNSEYTCSILNTRAQFWVHVLNSEYTCSILNTRAQFWVHVLILSTRAPFWIHVLNSEYKCSILTTSAQFLLPLRHEKIRLSLIRWARRTRNLPSKSSPLFWKGCCQSLPNVFPTSCWSSFVLPQQPLPTWIIKEFWFTSWQRNKNLLSFKESRAERDLSRLLVSRMLPEWKETGAWRRQLAFRYS